MIIPSASVSVGIVLPHTVVIVLCFKAYKMRLITGKKGNNTPLVYPLALGVILSCALAYPSGADDYVLNEKEYSSPGAHQLASWLASQMRPKEIVIKEIPVIPYRLPIQGKRNSEVTNAIIGSEETQKMYRDGKK